MSRVAKEPRTSAQLQTGGAAAIALALFAVAGLAAASELRLPLRPLSSLGHLKPAPPPGMQGPEGIPIPNAPVLAYGQVVSLGRKIDGIVCQQNEQVAYHVHTHLTIFVRGKARQVPYGIGIGSPLRNVNPPPGQPFVGGTCYMWLHTHASDGIIHIESPDSRRFTLGQFFDVWGQPLNRNRVGPARGPVTALYNGKVYTGNLRRMPLGSHTRIQLEVGKPLVAPEKVANWYQL
jgi:hypothetical protein